MTKTLAYELTILLQSEFEKLDSENSGPQYPAQLLSMRRWGCVRVGSTETAALERFGKRSMHYRRRCPSCGALVNRKFGSVPDYESCRACGVPLPRRTRRGLPKEYCSARCRKLAWIQKRES